MTGPHQETPLHTAGPALEDAPAAIVLIHGRGATARGILDLGRELDIGGLALLVPQAAGRTWYPNSFLEPVTSNEPGLSSGLARIDSVFDTAISAGIDRSRIGLIGFSQGACLASEYIARNPRRYGCLGALSGGLIGETVVLDEYEGSLDDTPVFLGCSTNDPHIPASRVEETASVFRRLNAAVTMRLYEGLGHGINEDELSHLSTMVQAMVP